MRRRSRCPKGGRRRIRGQSGPLSPAQFAAQGLQGFLAAQGLHGLAAAQGLHGFFAAQGLHGLAAAQGLHGFAAKHGFAQQGLQGFCAQAEHGFAPAAIDTPGAAMAMAAAAAPAARAVLNLLSLIGICFLSSQYVETDRVVSLWKEQ